MNYIPFFFTKLSMIRMGMVLVFASMALLAQDQAYAFKKSVAKYQKMVDFVGTLSSDLDVSLQEVDLFMCQFPLLKKSKVKEIKRLLEKGEKELLRKNHAQEICLYVKSVLPQLKKLYHVAQVALYVQVYEDVKGFYTMCTTVDAEEILVSIINSNTIKNGSNYLFYACKRIRKDLKRLDKLAKENEISMELDRTISYLIEALQEVENKIKMRG